MQGIRPEINSHLCILAYFIAFVAIAPSRPWWPVFHSFILSHIQKSHRALPCFHTNIHSKHSSWEPAGGELRRYHRGGFVAGKSHHQLSDQATLEWRTECCSCYSLTQAFLLYQTNITVGRAQGQFYQHL